MDNFVKFRSFEEKDVQFVFECHNNPALGRLMVGGFLPMSMNEAEKWVNGCINNNNTYIYWAICTNDDEERIIGWCSLGRIDALNKSGAIHGILIGDPRYQVGYPCIETHFFLLKYSFEVLQLHRLENICLTEHIVSMTMAKSMNYSLEGIRREAIFKNGRFYDIAVYGMLAEEYYASKERGDYQMDSILEKSFAIHKSLMRTNR